MKVAQTLNSEHPCFQDRMRREKPAGVEGPVAPVYNVQRWNIQAAVSFRGCIRPLRYRFLDCLLAFIREGMR
jgi:hypothetical protein